VIGWAFPRLVNWNLAALQREIVFPERCPESSREEVRLPAREVRRTAANPAAAPIPAPMPRAFHTRGQSRRSLPRQRWFSAIVPASFPLPPGPMTLPSESIVSLPPESALRGVAFSLTV